MVDSLTDFVWAIIGLGIGGLFFFATCSALLRFLSDWRGTDLSDWMETAVVVLSFFLMLFFLAIVGYFAS